MSGNTVYDYAAIEECNAAFKAEVEAMQEDIDRFQSEVATLVEETWGGAAAAEYNNAADGLNNDLEQRKNVLMNLDQTLRTAASDMGDTDRQGGKNIAASV